MNTDNLQDLVNIINEVKIFGKNKINLEFKSDSLSYFSIPERGEYIKLDQIPFENKEAFELFLFQFWNNNELKPLMVEIVKMAYEMKSINEEQQADLSPYIYTMF